MILPVKTSLGEYDIVLERGALNRLSEYLPNTGKALIVTDDGVPGEYARAAAAACPGSEVVTLPQGALRITAGCFTECWRQDLRVPTA